MIKRGRPVKSEVEEAFSKRAQPRKWNFKYSRKQGDSSVAAVEGAKGRMAE